MDGSTHFVFENLHQTIANIFFIFTDHLPSALITIQLPIEPPLTLATIDFEK